jgi:hypothetical protein
MDDGVDAEWRSSLQTQLKEIFAILGDQCQDLRQVSYILDSFPRFYSELTCRMNIRL